MSIFNDIASYFQYNSFGLLYLAAGVFNISVGLVVLLKDRSNPLNRSFFYVTGTAFIWVTSIAMQNLTADPEKARFWLRTQYFFGVPFISPTVYLFSSRWIRRSNRPLAYLGFLCSFLAMIPYCFFPSTVWRMRETPWGRYPSFITTPFGTVCVSFLLIYFFAYAFMAFGNFYRGWRRSENPREKAQFRNILVGFLLAYTGSFDFVAAFDVNVFPFGFVSLGVLIGVVAYTMLRHEFLDINLILKKGLLILLIYTSLLAITFPAAIPLAMKFSRHPPDHPLAAILGFGLMIGIVLSFGPVIYAALVRRSFWLRGTFSTGLTHELKSPLGVIQSAVQILFDSARSRKGDRTQNLEYLHMIQKNAERLEVFTNDLLKLARIQDGEVSIEKTSVNLGKIARETVEDFKLLAADKSLAVHCAADSLPLVQADPAKIRQVFSNLLSNAIKFSRREGKVQIELKKRDTEIQCSVSDQGCGMQPKDVERIFERFYQAKKSAKGSGIGLTIAKGWVEAHGGKIWAESEGEGKGTKVTFTLPLI